jgi:hypothetical protein
VARVTVTPATPTLQTGATVQLNATTTDASGATLSGRTVTWATNNSGVATVSQTGLVSALSPGSASISATSEGVVGATLVTVNASTPPSGNKIDTIFYDGFESGTFTKWTDGYNSTKHHILTDAAGAVAGTHYLDVTYTQGSDGGWLNTWFMPGYDSAFVRAYFKVESAWTGGTKFFSLYGNRTDDMWSASGKAGICPTGTDFFSAMIVTEPSGGSAGLTPPLRFYTYWPDMNPAGGCYGNYGNGSETYTPPLQITTGAWHKIEFWLKINTVGQTNAVQKFWVDGQLKGSWSGIRLRTSNILRINELQLAFSVCCGGATRTQHGYVDEVLVTTAPVP